MKRLLTGLLLLCGACLAQVPFPFSFLESPTANPTGTGALVGAEIAATGDYAILQFAGLSTNGTFSYGLGANNQVTGGGANPKLTFKVNRPGYTTNGVLGTIQDTYWGTFRRRFPYSSNAFPDTAIVNTTNVQVKVYLNDYVMTNETVKISSLLSGFYTGGSASLAANNVTVTNLSTNLYSSLKPVANWAWPGYSIVTNDFTLRVVAFSRWGRDFQPVSAVKFSVTDGTTTVEITDSTPEIDGTMPDAMPVIEYTATFDPSSFTQGAVLTANFVAYPHVGDSTGILDTATTGFTMPTAMPAPLKLLNDPGNIYYRSVAVVDKTSGNDATGVAIAWTNFNSASPPAAFATIGKAAAALATNNNTVASRNMAEGVIYCQTQNYNFTGSANSYGVTPNSWTVITRFPGLAVSDVVITNTASNTDISDRVKLDGITINALPATTSIFVSVGALWLDQCVMTGPDDRTMSTVAYYNLTHCTITNWRQGINVLVPASSGIGVIRGNTAGNMQQDFATPVAARVNIGTVIGNSFVNTMTNKMDINTSLFGVSPHGMPIFAFNKVTQLDTTVASAMQIWMSAIPASYIGTALVQNEIENVTFGAGFIDMAGSSIQNVNNVIDWHNTFVGGKGGNEAYNDTGSSAMWRVGWSLKNRATSNRNIKGDTFPTQNSARIGNFANWNGVGFSGNFFIEEFNNAATGGASGNVGSPANFPNEFSGIHSMQPPIQPGNQNGGANNSLSAAGWINRLAYAGNGTNATSGITPGNGVYGLTNGSALINLPIHHLLPFDLAGNPRVSTNDAAGAYVYDP